MVRYVKPRAEVAAPWHRLRIMASAVVNDSPSRWDYCRDMENILILLLDIIGQFLIDVPADTAVDYSLNTTFILTWIPGGRRFDYTCATHLWLDL